MATVAATVPPPAPAPVPAPQPFSSQDLIPLSQRPPGQGSRGTRISVVANVKELQCSKPDVVAHEYRLIFKECQRSSQVAIELPVGISRLFRKLLWNELISTGRFGEQAQGAIFDGTATIFSPAELPQDLLKTNLFEVDRDEEGVSLGETKRFEYNLEQLTVISLGQLLNSKKIPPRDIVTLSGIDRASVCINVLLKYGPWLKYPGTARAFFPNARDWQNAFRGNMPRPDPVKPIRGGVQARRGLFQTTRFTEIGPAVNFDTTSTAFYDQPSNSNHEPLINVLLSTAQLFNPGPPVGGPPGQRGGGDPMRLAPGRIPPETMILLNKLVKGMTIICKTARGDVHERIKTLTKEDAANRTFEHKRLNKTFTIAGYFTQIGLEVRYPGIPCVESRRAGVIPLEYCKLLSGQRFIKKLNEAQQSEAQQWQTLPPQQRYDAIQTFFNLLDTDHDPHTQQPLSLNGSVHFDAFGIQVKPDFLTGPARLLPPPVLQYGNGSFPGSATGKDRQEVPGKWNLQNKRFFDPVPLACWGVIIFTNDRDPERAQRPVRTFMDTLLGAAEVHGMVSSRTVHPENPKFRGPIVLAPANPTDQQLMQVFRDVMNQATRSAANLYGGGLGSSNACQMLFCILPNPQKRLYNAIKRVADGNGGIATSCVQSSKIAKPPNALRQYCSNVLVKVNAKLGGINHQLIDNDYGWLFNDTKTTMVLGADLIHANSTAERPSVAAVVASMDKHQSRYEAAIRAQALQEPPAETAEEKTDSRGSTGNKPRTTPARPKRIEIIVHLTEMVMELLGRYKQLNNVLPDRIVYFRDGGSEGELKQILDLEGDCINAACENFTRQNDGIPYSPAITMISGAKRHHIRFFSIPQQQQSQQGQNRRNVNNVQSGTIVDRGVVHPRNWNYYLVSHNAILGTSVPVNYTVLRDQNGIGHDDIHQVSHHLTFLQQRTTTACSDCVPISYAHLLCRRARSWLGDDYDDDTATNASDRTAAAQQRQARFVDYDRIIREKLNSLRGTSYARDFVPLWRRHTKMFWL